MRALHTLLIGVIACAPPPNQGTGPGAQQGQQPYGQPQYGQPYGQPQYGATCEGACQHYLGCKGLSDGGSWQQCLDACRARQVSPDELAQYQQTDCATAISIVENPQGGQQGGTGSSTDCTGCVRDGDSCIWMSSGNWGAGPYSGAVSSCAPSCCGM